MTITPRTILWINRKFKIIAIAFAVLVLLVGYFVILAPGVRKLVSVELSSIQQLEDQKLAEQAKLDRVMAFVNQYKKVSPEDLARVERILPKQADLPLLYQQVPALVEAAGLKLDAISIAESAAVPIEAAKAPGGRTAVAGKALGAVDVSLTISGGKSYSDLRRFLDSVEKNLRVFDIGSISFPTVPATDDSGDVSIPSYSVSLHTYFFAPAA